MNRTGNSAKYVAERYNASYSTTNYNDILSDPDIDMVLISTRHDSHANLSLKALKKVNMSLLKNLWQLIEMKQR